MSEVRFVWEEDGNRQSGPWIDMDTEIRDVIARFVQGFKPFKGDEL